MKEVPVTAAFRAEQIRSHSDSHYGDSARAPSYSAHNDQFKNAQRRDESARSVPPSQVLMVRLLPLDIEEGEVCFEATIGSLFCADGALTLLHYLYLQLQVVFAEFDGVQDIRLIRDRATNLSRGFGFVEFRDIEVRLTCFSC